MPGGGSRALPSVSGPTGHDPPSSHLCRSPGGATFWISLPARDPLFGHGCLFHGRREAIVAEASSWTLNGAPTGIRQAPQEFQVGPRGEAFGRGCRILRSVCGRMVGL